MYTVHVAITYMWMLGNGSINYSVTKLEDDIITKLNQYKVYINVQSGIITIFMIKIMKLEIACKLHICVHNILLCYTTANHALLYIVQYESE